MSGQASSSTAAAPGAPHPRPQGRAPKEHTWDGSYGESGAWLHNVTGLPWAKGGRSAASMAQQRERKREDKRDRSGRPEASGAQKRKKGAVEAERRDRNRRLNVINQYRTAARKKKKIPLDSSHPGGGSSPLGCDGLGGLSLEPLEPLAKHSQLLGRVHGSGRRGWGPVGAPASPRGGGLLPRVIFGLCGPFVLVSVGSALRRGFAHIVGRTEGRRGGLLPEKVAGPAQSSLCVMPLELGRARKGHAQARANNWEVHS